MCIKCEAPMSNPVAREVCKDADADANDNARQQRCMTDKA